MDTVATCHRSRLSCPGLRSGGGARFTTGHPIGVFFSNGDKWWCGGLTSFNGGSDPLWPLDIRPSLLLLSAFGIHGNETAMRTLADIVVGRKKRKRMCVRERERERVSCH